MKIRIFSVVDIERISNERNDKGWADYQERKFVPLEDHNKEIEHILRGLIHKGYFMIGDKRFIVKGEKG